MDERLDKWARTLSPRAATWTGVWPESAGVGRALHPGDTCFLSRSGLPEREVPDSVCSGRIPHPLGPGGLLSLFPTMQGMSPGCHVDPHFKLSGALAEQLCFQDSPAERLVRGVEQGASPQHRMSSSNRDRPGMGQQGGKDRRGRCSC